MIPLRAIPGGVDIPVKAVPKSSRDRIAGEVGGRVKVCVTAAPEKGKANSAVEAIVAEALGLPRSAVAVVAGATSPKKTVRVAGVREEDVRRRLEEMLRGPV